MTSAQSMRQVVSILIRDLKSLSVEAVWAQCRAQLSAEWRYRQVNQAVIDELIRRLEAKTDAERRQFIVTDQFDLLVYELLDNYEGGAPVPAPTDQRGQKRKRENQDDGAPKTKRPTLTDRQLAAIPKLAPPTLTIVSEYAGAVTQKLGDIQEFKFKQVAQLVSEKAPNVRELYHFVQYVMDSWTIRSADDAEAAATQELDDWEWDKPYGPPYEDSVINVAVNGITFTDYPGFSKVGNSDTRIANGRWLLAYEVHFHWKVIRQSDMFEWTSPVIKHTLTCAYNGGAPVAVKSKAAGSPQWTVKLAKPE